MEIDFHFGATYAVARLAEFDHEQATIIATSSQYIDDTVNSGIVKFRTGESYYRICTAHEFTDYHLLAADAERRTWVPFHFLPGNDLVPSDEGSFYSRIVCRPHSPPAVEMARTCIDKQDAPWALHRLGITSHVFIDTWAHQGFAGIKHKINNASHIVLSEPSAGSLLLHLWHLHIAGGLKAIVGYLLRPLMQRFTNHVFPMGHGAVLHYPDHPFRKWSYVNGHGTQIFRDNPTDFSTALKELYRVYMHYQLRDLNANVPSIPAADQAVIDRLIQYSQDEDAHVRLKAWLDAIEGGKFSFGRANPLYQPSGPGSWKHAALGVEHERISERQTFEFTPDFMNSNWKLFHDAVQAHQHDILHEVLPSFGICAI